MKNIFKSFFKTYWKNWYQSLAFIIFILISSALTIGFISNSLQVTILTTQISQQEKKWDYEFSSPWANYDDNFIYNYFQNENDINNQLNENLVNLAAIVNIDADGRNFEKLNDYLQYAFDNYQKDFFPDYQAFLGNFFKTQIFSLSYLYSHQILLPNYSATPHPPPQPILVKFYDVINEKWIDKTSENYNATYNVINEYLVMQYNALYRNNKIAIDYNFQIEYQWSNPKYGNANIFYHLEPINLNLSNNIVTNLNHQRLQNMKDDEILVNEKFALEHNLKIGDIIKINDAVTKEEDFAEPFFNKEYKIIGFGIKSNNLFSTIQFLNSTAEEAIIYLTDHEMKNYLRYLWFYDTRFWLPNGRDQIIDWPTPSLRLLAEPENITKFNNFTTQTIKAGQVLDNITNYDNLGFVRVLQLYTIESILFIVIGAIALLLSILFVNYCINKELKQIASQLGLFKSMGYKNIEIASVLWTRTFLTLIIGFALGFFVSIPIQIVVNHLLISNFLVVIQAVWTNVIFLLMFFLILPILLSLLNLWSIDRYLSFNSLQMIQMTGGSQFDPKENKYFSWYKKKITLAKLNFIKPFSIKQIVKFLLVPFFFIIGTTLLVLEFNVKTLVTDLTTFNQTTYNQKIDHMFGLSKRFDWYFDNDLKKYYLKDSEEYNLQYQEYNDLNDLIARQDQAFNQLLNHYLTIDRTEPLTEETKQEILATLNQILNTNVNYGVYNFTDIEKVLTQVVKDYYLFIKEIFPDLEPKIIEIKEQWVDNFPELDKRLSNKKTQITFNNVFFKPNVDYPILKINLINDGFSYPSSENWTLNFLDDYNKDIFLLNHYDKLKENNFTNDDARTLPVIITNHFAVFNKIKIGDKFLTSLGRSHDDSTIECQVVAINEIDNYSNNIYASYDYFTEKLLGSQILTPLYNAIFSKNQLLTATNNNHDFIINSDYFNFYYPTTNNAVTLEDILSNTGNLYNFVNWNNINSKNFQSVTLEKNAANKQVTDFETLSIMLIIFTLLVLTTLFVVFSIINSIDFKHETIILKAFGYTNNWINFKLLKKYMIAIVLAIITSILITYLLWKIVINYFYQAKILVANPFNYLPIMIMIISLLVIFALAWTLSYIIIKRTNPAPK